MNHIKLLALLAVTGMLLVSDPFAIAQIPIPYTPGWCGVTDPVDGREPKTKADPKLLQEFSTPGSGICDRYTAGAGWEFPMKLQLGEGAADYLPLIELAVKSWSEAVQPRWENSWGALIQISDEPPTNFRLPEKFWENPWTGSWENRGDGENVIYFSPYPDNRRLGGLATPQVSGSWALLGADIYINTADQEEWSEYTLTTTKKIFDVDSSRGVYVYLNHTYNVILHELGHAIGLRHVPVVGNVMNTGRFIDGMASQWRESMILSHIASSEGQRAGQVTEFELMFARPHSKVSPYMALRGQRDLALTEFYTELAKLGAQEKMLLSCIYEVY